MIGNGVGTQAGIQYRSSNATPFGTAPITVNAGGLLSGDTGAAGTIPNNITLNGGIIGTQSKNITDSGNNTVQSASLIGSPPNLAGVNSTTGSILISGPISGPGSLTKTTGDPCTFSGANTYAGNTTLAGGVVTLNRAEIQGTSGPLGNVSATAANTLFLTGSTLQYSAANSFDYSGRFSTAGSQSWTIDTNSQNVTFASSLQGTGSTLTKAGVGTLFLVGANTFTGNTVVSAGTLNLMNSLALQNSVIGSAGIVFDSSVASNAFTVGGLTGGGTLVLQNNAASPAPIALTVGNNTATASYTGVISGAGSSLTKIGSGIQVLTGANSYSSGTTVSSGTLQIGNAAANGTFGTGTYVIQSGATLLLNYATAVGPTWANISGAGTLELNSAQAVNGTANWSAVAPSLSAGFAGTLRLDNGRINGIPSNFGGTTNFIFNNGSQFLAFDGTNNGASYVWPQIFSINGLGWGEANFNLGAIRVAGMAATFSGAITLLGNAGLFTQGSSAGSIRVNNVVSDGGAGFGLTINAVGTPITLAAADTFSGGTTVVTGTVNLSNPLALQNSVLTPGGTATVFDSSVAGNAFFVAGLAGSASLALRNNATTPAPIALFVGNNNASSSYGGVLTADGSISKIGTGSLAVSGQSTFTGGVTVLSGSILFNASTTGNVASGPAGTAPITLGDIGGSTGVASLLAAGAFTIANPIIAAASSGGTPSLGGNSILTATFSGGITLNNNLTITQVATGALSLTGSIASGGGPQSLIFANGGPVTKSGGAMGDGSGMLSVVQAGTGSTTLTGADTYTGSTTASAGTLFLNGSNTTSAINVAGSATFGGIGTALSAVAMLEDGGTLDAGIGGGGTFGTLTLNGLNFPGSGTIDIGPLAGYTASAPLLVTGSGALTLSGGPGSVAIDIANVGGIPFNTPVKLLGYSGSIGGTGSSAFVLGPLPNRASGSLTDVPGTEIDLTITSTDALIWTGAASNVWDTTSLNWKLSSDGTPTAYTDPGDSVVFDDRATTNTTILLDSQNVSPSNVSFNNSTDSYTLTGPFGIVGTAGLTKSGTGTTTLAIADSYSGATSVNAGVLNIQNGAALGSTVSGTTVASGAALQLQGGISFAFEPITLSGTGVANDGVLRNISGNNTFAGPISIGSATRINSDSGTLVLSNTTPITTAQNLVFGGAGNISFSPVTEAIQTGASSVTKDGSGTLVFPAANTYTGGTTITGGTLQLGTGTANGTFGPGLYNVATSGRLLLNYATGIAVGTWAPANLSGAGTLELNSAQPVNGTAQFGQNSPALTNFSSAFTGTLQVDNGRIDSSPAGLGGVSGIVINSGAQFLAWSGTYNIPITIAGTGWGEAGQPGACVMAGANTGTWAGPITLAADSYILSQGNANFTLTGAITGAFNTQFDAQGGATIVVAPSAAVQNSYASSTIIGAGAVIAGNPFAFSTGPLTMNGGTLKLNGNTLSFAEPRAGAASSATTAR